MSTKIRTDTPRADQHVARRAGRRAARDPKAVPDALPLEELSTRKLGGRPLHGTRRSVDGHTGRLRVRLRRPALRPA